MGIKHRGILRTLFDSLLSPYGGNQEIANNRLRLVRATSSRQFAIGCAALRAKALPEISWHKLHQAQSERDSDPGYYKSIYVVTANILQKELDVTKLRVIDEQSERYCCMSSWRKYCAVKRRHTFSESLQAHFQRQGTFRNRNGGHHKEIADFKFTSPVLVSAPPNDV